jgi:hypothetical protein
MALINPTYIANSKYTYTVDNQTFCRWFADLFNIDVDKSYIMKNLLNEVNDYLIDNVWLIAIFNNKDDENYYHFKIYWYVESYTEENYINSWREYWFGFIANRLI